MLTRPDKQLMFKDKIVSNFRQVICWQDGHDCSSQMQKEAGSPVLASSYLQQQKTGIPLRGHSSYR